MRDWMKYYKKVEAIIVSLLNYFEFGIDSTLPDVVLRSRAQIARATQKQHRYHEAILGQLGDSDEGPLYELLGHGKIHETLRSAKQTRNKCKMSILENGDQLLCGDDRQYTDV